MFTVLPTKELLLPQPIATATAPPTVPRPTAPTVSGTRPLFRP